MQYPYNTEENVALSCLVYCKTINFFVREFLDYKTLNADGGRIRAFEKVSLAEIHVEIEIHTRKGSAFDNEWFLSRWATTTPNQATFRASKKDLTWNPQYLIYRDANGDHTVNGFIKENPEYENPATEALPSYKLQKVRQKDKTTDIVRDSFSFTRKIQSGGPYYLTPEKIWSLRGTSISSLINEIEGQSADSTGNLVKWPEYFNFLFTPLNADMVMAIAGTQLNTALVTPNFHTELHIKTSATWLCMQSSQATGTVSRKQDPYFKANAAMNEEIARSFGTH